MTVVGHKAAQYVASGCVLLALALTAVFLRFLSAWKLRQSLRPRDYFVTISIVSLSPLLIFSPHTNDFLISYV